MITVVLSSSRQQFVHWCREEECHPEDRTVKSVVRPDDLPRLRGLNRPLDVHIIGDFWATNPYAQELYEEVRYVQLLNANRPDPDPPRPWSWGFTTS